MTAIVMAAGLSTRMGADKLTLPLEENPSLCISCPVSVRSPLQNGWL